MKCVLLCAGYSLDENMKLKETASSLLVIAKKPLINYVLEELEIIDEIDKIYLVTNGLYYDKFLEWEEKWPISSKLKIINDNTMAIDANLGAIGDIQYTINMENINDDLLVLSGDSYHDFSISDFITKYKEKQEVIVAGKNTEDKEILKNYGVIKEENNIVVNIQEKPNEPKGTILSLGAYIFPEEVLKMINEYLSEGYKRTYPGYFLEYLYRFRPIHVYKIAGMHYDMKSQKSLEILEETLARTFDN